MARQEQEAARGQITAEAAEIYEKFFVPALFGQFAPWLAEAAGIDRGDQVLDVATGTGVAARAALARGAEVTAVDINPGMLEVADRIAPQADYRAAAAEDLPFADGSFDAVTCQFGLMFFDDRQRALREMRRVCRGDGQVAVAVFDAWQRSPGYRDLIPLIAEMVGPEAAEALKAPFCLGEDGDLRDLLDAAGLEGAEIATRTGVVRHRSLGDWLDTEIGGWTLAEMVDAPMMSALKKAASDRLARYVQPDGRVAFDTPALFAVASP